MHPRTPSLSSITGAQFMVTLIGRSPLRSIW
jgi:hypothetical protein